MGLKILNIWPFYAWWRHMVSWVFIKTGSGNGLLPDGTKLLPEPMLACHQYAPVADIHPTAIPLEMFKIWINGLRLNIKHLKSTPHLQGNIVLQTQFSLIFHDPNPIRFHWWQVSTGEGNDPMKCYDICKHSENQIWPKSLRWRHNGHDGVSLDHLFRRRSKKTSKLRVTGLVCREFTGDRWIPRTNGQ